MQGLLGKLFTLALCWALSKGIESEQCVELGRGKVSTLSFRTELHKLPPDFWSKGVDNSKMILETILGKIKLYEKGQDKKWAELIQNIGNQYSDVSGGEVWLDDKKSQTVRVETIQGQEPGFCGLNEPISGQIEYNCAESEQLYGIGYHKVYEACKHNPILANYKVDWGVCLHAHYPWIDLLTSHICVMKSYNNDFIACFCAMDQDSNKLKSRGFCITKFECLLNKAGVEKSKPYEVPSTSSSSAISPQLILQIIHAAGQVSHDCAAHVQYFIEANTKDTVWFGVAQQKDNLRVRPPYHPESPCRNVHFSGQFDIGQLDVDNIEAGIEVYTPFIANVYNDPETDWVPPEKEEPEEPQECAPPLVNNIDPVHKARMDLLSFFFEERIMADLIIWLPGILFLYSSMCEERNRAMQLLVTLIQSLVITIGVYNIVISAIPLDMLKDLAELRHLQMVAFSTFFCVVIIVLNFKEVTEFFLKLALVCFIPDIVFWKMVVVMYTKDRMENFKIIYVSFLLIIGLASTYNVVKIVIEAHQKKRSIECQSSAGQVKVTKKRKNKQVKTVKQDSPKPSNPEVVNQAKAPAAAKCPSPSSHVVCPKKVSKETGSLTSSLLEKVPAKAKSKSRKLQVQGIQQRSSSETSSSSGEGPESSPLSKTRDQKFCTKNLHPGSKPPSKPLVSFMSDVDIRNHASLQYETKAASNETCGIERQIRPDNVKVQTQLDQTSHQSHLVDRLVQQYCPQSTDPSFNITHKSKILTIIQENNHQEDVPPRGGQKSDVKDIERDRSGFLLGSAALPPPSDSLFFVPGQHVSKRVPSPPKAEVEVKIISKEGLTSPTLEYKCGAKSSVSKDLLTRMEGGFKEVAYSNPVPGPVPDNLDHITSPLTRILVKEIDNYPAADVDKATKEILLYTNIEDLTIPEFQKIVVEKLQQEQEKIKDIYISDESASDEEDECHICLASLDEELEVLEGCGHIFHVSCISSWVARKESEKICASCPKCRAVI